MPKNDWSEYKQLFLRKMDEDEKRWEKMFDMVGALRNDVSGLKVKAAVAGGAAGVVATGIISFFVSFWHGK